MSFILPASSRAAEEISFNRDVRPILSENCYSCHGPDKSARKGDRRLDTLEGALAENDGFRALVPGDLEKSDLWQRIISSDADDVMPPPKSDKKLSAPQIAILKRWIEAGAKYEPHWAFIPPQRPTVPQVKGFPGSSPIDSFLASRLEREGLRFSPEADKPALIRRLRYDLTGLPPTPAEIDAFVADSPPQAYAKLVDRLLASPEFGEKMAVHWLDLARYADTHGFHLDAGREQWPWRDWVIEAFNKGLPFDRFVSWQIAGDLLPNATLEQKLATGFLRNNMINFEGGAIPEEYRTAYVKDRVSTVGTAFLGLTLACSECHDHKFDPISQRDYYQLYAYFNAVTENGLDGSKGNAAPLLELPATPEVQAKLDALTAQIATSEKQLLELTRRADAEQVIWEGSLVPQPAVQWTVLKPESASSTGGAELVAQNDDSLLVQGANSVNDVFELLARTDRAGITGLRIEALTDPSLAGNGPGRAPNGNFVMSGIDLDAAPVAAPTEFKPVKLVAAQADHEQKTFPIGHILDANPKTGWAVDGDSRHEPRTAWIAAGKPFGFEGGTLLRIRLRFETPHAQHGVGRPRLAITTETPVISTVALPPEIAQVLGTKTDQRTPEQRKKLTSYYREKVSPVLRQPTAQLAALREQLKAEQKKRPTAMVMQEMAKPRDSFILVRGQYNAFGEKVEPALPGSLGPIPADAPKNRLALAQWLTDPKHPLMARVAVNRFWKNIMGTGIVKTVNDFGLQGEWPQHPELLDWLACEFIESGWDVKHLVRLIVSSSAYRQTGKVTPEGLARDPENRLYARGPRFRLSAEEVRDTALAVSGLLNPKIGGASVYPYQPPGLWEELNSRQDSKQWTAQFFEQSHGPDLYRRSMYTFVKRTSPPPQMTTFDAPDRETCTASRERTNTPLQALVTLNDVQFVEAARKLAERAMQEGGATPAERAKFAFRVTTARLPTERELTMLTELFTRAKARYAPQPEEAAKLLSTGEAPRDEKLEPVELAAWTIVASTILNLDENVTKG